MELVVNALARLILSFCAKIVAITLCGCVVFVLITHFHLGNASPGVVAIVLAAMGFWIPLIVIVFMGLPLIVGCRIMWLAYRQASGLGMPLTRYFELSRDDRERLVRQYRERGSAL